MTMFSKQQLVVFAGTVMVLTALCTFAFGQAPVVEVVSSKPTILDQISALLAALTPIIGFLVGTGLVWKYVPFMKNLPNVLIPFLNAVIAFIGVFQGGPAAAHAGIFGDFVHALSFPAKAMGSLMLSTVASAFYETFIRPTLEKAKIYPAGLTASEKAARAKISG